jgi:hypothetical protein
VSVELNTARGRYRLELAAPPRNTRDEVILSLAYERADGLERVGFLCSVATELVDTNEPGDSGVVLLERVAPWFEREFEHTRETALKSIRTDRRPLTVRFDGDHPGPFLR